MVINAIYGGAFYRKDVGGFSVGNFEKNPLTYLKVFCPILLSNEVS